jgi:hypothetical protein
MKMTICRIHMYEEMGVSGFGLLKTLHKGNTFNNQLTNAKCCCHAWCPHAINVYRTNGKVDKIGRWNGIPAMVQWYIRRGRGGFFG